MIRKFFFSLWIFFLLALLSFLLIMGSENQSETPTPETSVAPAGLMSSPNLTALAQHLGVSVPYLSGSGTGKVEDVQYAGGTARLLTWTEDNGVEIQCVRPAVAASLLHKDALSPDLGTIYSIGDMPAFFCTGRSRCAVYFGDDDAAYCISAPLSANDMLDLISNIRFKH